QNQYKERTQIQKNQHGLNA
ncbi:hypothetical protein D046_2440B, partial [Vibrio parahaemolyticus V-223/04]